MILPSVVRSGCDAEARLRPSRTESEPGDDLVEDKQGAVSAGDGAQVLEETGSRRDDPNVRDDWLHDDRGDLAGVRLERRRDRTLVVEWQHDGGRRDRVRNASAGGDRLRRETRSRR